MAKQPETRLEGAQWLPAAREQLADAQQRTWLFRRRSDALTAHDRCHRSAGPAGAKPLRAELAEARAHGGIRGSRGLPRAVCSCRCVSARGCTTETALASARPGPHPFTTPDAAAAACPSCNSMRRWMRRCSMHMPMGARSPAPQRSPPPPPGRRRPCRAVHWSSRRRGASAPTCGLVSQTGPAASSGGRRPACAAAGRALGQPMQGCGRRRPCTFPARMLFHQPANQLPGPPFVMHAVPGALRGTAALFSSHPHKASAHLSST